MLRSYVSLVVSARALPLVTASGAGRLAVGLTDLPLVLVARSATGAYVLAGATVAAFCAGYALLAPWRGRLVDRRRPRRVLVPLAIAKAALLCTLAAVAGHTPSAALLALAALIGASSPPLAASMRIEWQRLLGRRSPRLEQAYALETSVQWSVFVVGPFLAGAVIAAAGARASLVVAAALTVAGGVPFGFLARGAPDARDVERGRLAAAIRLPGMRTLVAATVLTDAALGAVEFAVAAFARDRGQQAIAGVLLGVFCASSVVGGLAYGTRRWQLSTGRRLVMLQAVAMALLLPLPLAQSLVEFGILLALAGAPFAAAWATSSLSVDDVAPPASAGEAYSLLNAGNGVGVALGGAAAGALTQVGGTSAALIAAAFAVGLAALWTLGRLGTLAPRPRTALDRA